MTPIDIDECREETDGCGQICSNTVGSYTCGCYNGYRLATDRHACNGTMILSISNIFVCYFTLILIILL